MDLSDGKIKINPILMKQYSIALGIVNGVADNIADNTADDRFTPNEDAVKKGLNSKLKLDPMMLKQYNYTIGVVDQVSEKDNSEISEEEKEDFRKKSLKEFRSQIDAIESLRAGILKEGEPFICEGLEQMLVFQNKNGEVQFLYRV